MRSLDDVMAALPHERREKIHMQAQETLLQLDLAQLRKKAGLSQSELAQKMGISQSAISQFENTQNLNLATLARYVQILGGKLNISIE